MWGGIWNGPYQPSAVFVTRSVDPSGNGGPNGGGQSVSVSDVAGVIGAGLGAVAGFGSGGTIGVVGGVAGVFGVIGAGFGGLSDAANSGAVGEAASYGGGF